MENLLFLGVPILKHIRVYFEAEELVVFPKLLKVVKLKTFGSLLLVVLLLL